MCQCPHSPGDLHTLTQYPCVQQGLKLSLLGLATSTENGGHFTAHDSRLTEGPAHGLLAPVVWTPWHSLPAYIALPLPL